MALRFEAAASSSAPERAELFTAAYEDYVVPFALDEARLGFMEGAFGTDLERSVLGVLGGERIGLANLAVDGEDGWVAGVGVVKAHRGAGHGEALMHELIERARDAGVRRLWLEVIVENVAARTLYEKLGFEHVRLLDVWRVSGEPGPAETVTAEAAHDRVRALRDWREPWQRNDATLSRLAAIGPEPVGVVAGDGAAVVRVADGLVTIVQVAAPGDAGYDAVVDDARRLGEHLLLLNLPEGHPAGRALARAGGEVAIRQHEMVLTL